MAQSLSYYKTQPPYPALQIVFFLICHQSSNAMLPTLLVQAYARLFLQASLYNMMFCLVYFLFLSKAFSCHFPPPSGTHYFFPIAH
jgi:hypothetical protein